MLVSNMKKGLLVSTNITNILTSPLISECTRFTYNKNALIRIVGVSF